MPEFLYARRRYRLEPAPNGTMRVLECRKAGEVELSGAPALRVLCAYRRKVLGEKVARRPRVYAKRPKPYRR